MPCGANSNATAARTTPWPLRSDMRELRGDVANVRADVHALAERGTGGAHRRYVDWPVPAADGTVHLVADAERLDAVIWGRPGLSPTVRGRGGRGAAGDRDLLRELADFERNLIDLGGWRPASGIPVAAD